MDHVGPLYILALSEALEQPQEIGRMSESKTLQDLQRILRGPLLSNEAKAEIQLTIEAEYACGSRIMAAALAYLLNTEDRHRKAMEKIEHILAKEATMSESTMIETAARALHKLAWGKEAHWPPHKEFAYLNFVEKAKTAIEALKSAGYLSPEQVKARDAAVERRALDRAANWHDEKIISTTYPDEVAFHEYSRDAILALSPSPTNWQEVPEGLECVAFRVCNDNYSLWIASTVAHDIMSQGDSFEEAKSRLEVAINADADGLKTGPSPIVKTFRAMIKAGSKP